MRRKPIPSMVRLSRDTAERVALWSGIMNTSYGEMLGIALKYWEKQHPFDDTPASAPDAKD